MQKAKKIGTCLDGWVESSCKRQLFEFTVHHLLLSSGVSGQNQKTKSKRQKNLVNKIRKKTEKKKEEKEDKEGEQDDIRTRRCRERDWQRDSDCQLVTQW